MIHELLDLENILLEDLEKPLNPKDIEEATDSDDSSEEIPSEDEIKEDNPSISIEKPEDIFKLKHNLVTKTLLMELFSKPNSKKDPKLPSNTKVKIDDKLVKESQSILALAPNYKEIQGTTTNVGRVMIHQFLLDIESNGVNLGSLVPFKNTALTKKVLGGQDNLVATLFIEEKIDEPIIREYTNRLQWLGYTSAIFSLPSLDLATVAPSKAIKKFRDEKLKENEEALKHGDLKAMDKIEKEVLAFAAKQLDEESATGKLIYDSGFNGDFKNNYKNTAIFRGIAPKSDNLSEFFIVTSSLSDGIKKTDIPAQADIGVTGASGRAKDTQLAGYKTKIFNAAFGSITSDKAGSDCKTKRTMLVDLNEDNFKYYRYRYVETNNGLVMLDDTTKKSFVGKKVKMRTPLYCTSESICNKCMGEMHYKLKTRNIGLLVSRITTNLMNKSMKSFHDMSVDPKTYNLLDYIESI